MAARPTSGGRGASPLARVLGRLLGLSVCVRLATFALNVAAARRVPLATWGEAQVKLHLLTATVTLLAREGLRRATQGAADAAARGTDGSWALRLRPGCALAAWLCAPLGAVIAAAAAWVAANATHDAGLRQAVWINAAGVALDLLSEPLAMLLAASLLVDARVAAEGAATLARCVTTYILVARAAAAHTPPSAVPFAWAQVAYGATLGLVYTAFCLVRVRGGLGALAPRPPLREASAVLRRAGGFGVQAACKLALAEGVKVALVALESSEDELGAFALADNLGSVVARVLLMPFEEAAFTAFSKAASVEEEASAGARASARKGSSSAVGDSTRLEAQGAALSAMLKVALLVGLLSAAFAPAYAFTALRLLYGEAKASAEGAAAALAAYGAYVAAMALNGTTEAFVHAVAAPTQLLQGNVALAAAAVIQATICFAWYRATGSLSATGIVVANMASMAARTAYSCVAIRAHLRSAAPLRAAVPSAGTLLALGVAGVGTLATQQFFGVGPNVGVRAHALHVACGALALAGVVAVAARAHARELSRQLHAIGTAPQKQVKKAD